MAPVPAAPRTRFGAIAQLGERYNGIVEVRGSIPLGSTNRDKGLAGNGWALVVFGQAEGKRRSRFRSPLPPRVIQGDVISRRSKGRSGEVMSSESSLWSSPQALTAADAADLLRFRNAESLGLRIVGD